MSGFRMKPVALMPAITGLAAYWLQNVNRVVPEPYLDEFFHVRQAKAYCQGRFDIWDPKITTPPGLYVLSYLYNRATGNCSIEHLRALNVWILALLFLVVMIIRSHSVAQDRRPYLTKSKAYFSTEVYTWDNAHNALNICFFPALFFFSGLYYTDVTSTIAVLVAHEYALGSQIDDDPEKDFRLVPIFITVLLGSLSLFFRQTNIFWVAVFPAGIALVRRLKTMGKANRPPELLRQLSWQTLIRHSFTDTIVYDIPVEQATFIDYIKTVISIAMASMGQVAYIIPVVIPYVLVLCNFGAFLFWNEGVVLGDKSNHVATVHLPQMLYIWPYFTFFSFPLMLPVLASILKQIANRSTTSTQSIRLPGVISSGLATGVAAVIVHFNTIIHPFTLADNRHYVFYVFRIIRRHWAIRYLAAPVYIGCAWLALQSLGGSMADDINARKAGSKSPSSTQTTNRSNTRSSKKSKIRQDIATAAAQPDAQVIARVRQQHAGDLQTGTHTSLVLVWLATCTLNLVTAPLVEPRYFILPWIFWRLHVPSLSNSPGSHDDADAGKASSVVKLLFRYRLTLETIWFLLVNAVTCYIFLRKPFIWPQEPTLLQRFMW